MGRSEMRDLHDPTQLGDRILALKEELKCSVLEAADRIYSATGPQPSQLPLFLPGRNGRPDTRPNP